MTRNKIKIISLVDDEIDTDECFCLLVSLFYFFFCMMQGRYANTPKDTTMNKIMTSIDVQLHNLYRYIFVRLPSIHNYLKRHFIILQNGTMTYQGSTQRASLFMAGYIPKQWWNNL